MQNIFLTILNTSITASYIAIAAILLRLFLKRSPKWISCLLWGLVALRLIIPFSFESRLSLVPDAEPVKPEVAVYSVDDSEQNNITYENASPVENEHIPQTPIAPVIPNNSKSEFIQNEEPVDSTEEDIGSTDIFSILSYIWSAGMLCMLGYTMISYLRILRRVRVSVSISKNIYICDHIATPFILGIINPRIYLPSALTEEEREYIVAHEKAHLKRLDHLIKPLGFLLLTIHWFNPLMWVCYILLSRDIELACDEKVLKNMGNEKKKEYSRILLDFSSERKLVSACPLAFGEVGVKKRIKNIINYKKPAFWVSLVALILCVTVGICFLTNPVKDKELPNEETTKNTDEKDVELPAYYLTDGCIRYSYTNPVDTTKDSYIELYPENNRFDFCINPIQSYTPGGTYKIEGNKLILTFEDKHFNICVFTFEDIYTLKPVASESVTTLPDHLREGAVFTLSDNSPKPISPINHNIVPYCYEEIISTIINLYQSHAEDPSAPIPYTSYASNKYLKHSDLSQIGYALIDLDNNGIDELVISGIDAPFVYDLYTMSEGNTLHLFSSGDRYAHTLYEDGYVSLSWNCTAALTGHDFMKLSDGKMEFLQRVTIDAYHAEETGVIEKLEDATDDNCYFKSATEYEKDYVHISSDEAHEILDYHQSKAEALNIEYTPLSQYTEENLEEELLNNGRVIFDIDGDGVEEECLIATPAVSSTQNPPSFLYVLENGEIEYAESLEKLISNTHFIYPHLEQIGSSLYLTLAVESNQKLIYEIKVKDGKLTTSDNPAAYDVINFDIDGDSIDETMYIHTTETGRFSIRISAFKNDSEFCDTLFTLDPCNPSFSEENGKLYLECDYLDEQSQDDRYEIAYAFGDFMFRSDNGTIIRTISSIY